MYAQSNPKRRKLDGGNKNNPTNSEDIKSKEDLRSALSFRQHDVSASRQGIRRFKEFLSSTQKAKDSPKAVKNLGILKSYCDEPSKQKFEKPCCLDDLLLTWNLAIETGIEPILSSIPAVIALFLKTVSGQLDFREHGIKLCNALLERDRLNLFQRGLTANKLKDHLISPCLRLLTEIVGFDGGSVAGRLYSRKDVTFSRLDVFLDQRGKPVNSDDGETAPPSLRTFAQRYFIANLTFQDTAAKASLISQPKTTRALVHGLKQDDSNIVADVLQALEKHVVGDASLHRSAKRRFFTDQTLASLAALYGFKPVSDLDTRALLIPQRVHTILRTLCTNQEKGLLQPQTGWYPPAGNATKFAEEWEGAISMGLDIPSITNRYSESVPIKNVLLSKLLRVLRPESDILQGELVLAIFKAAPELLADYFIKNPKFKSEPKADPIWLTQSAFLYKCIELPVPRHLGWIQTFSSTPPPESIVVENILPRPLNRETLARCMNMDQDVVTLFAVRALVIAFQKLKKVLAIFNDQHEASWQHAASKLKSLFSERIPRMKDAIALFQRNAKGEQIIRESAVTLLACYYELLPELAMGEKFNVSAPLAELLSKLSSEIPPEDGLDLEELSSLLNIALRSPGMRWWNKPENLDLSTFSSVLKLASSGQSIDQDSLRQLKKVVETVSRDYLILGADAREVEILLGSLRFTKEWQPHDSVFLFLDNCFSRLAKSPVHYQDLVQSIFSEGVMHQSSALLAAVVIEQWSYASSKEDKKYQRNIANWLARFFSSPIWNEISSISLVSFQEAIYAKSESDESRSVLRKAFKRHAGSLTAGAVDIDQQNSDQRPPAKVDGRTVTFEPSMDQVWKMRIESEQSRQPCKRWELEDVEVAVSEGHLSDMLLCLCSQLEETRLRAVSDMSTIMYKMLASKTDKWRPFYVLTGEALETAKTTGLDQPLPGVLGELAAKLVEVLKNPLHFLFGKVNKFLNKGPSWDAQSVLHYWMDAVILQDADKIDSSLNEISWLTDVLVQGLHGTEDVELYRRVHVFERMMSLSSMPTLTQPTRQRILELIFRMVELDNNMSVALRTGVASWLQCLKMDQRSDATLLDKLISGVNTRCGSEKLEQWEAGGKLVA